MQDKDKKVIDLQEVRSGDGVKYVPPGGAAEEAYPLCKKGNGKWWTLAIIFAIIAMVVILMVTSKDVVDEPEAVASQVVNTEDEIYKATYVERNLEYEGCGHTETSMLHGDSRFVGKTFSQLTDEGWEVSKVGSNTVRVSRREQGICEADSHKRTLRLTENGVGVFEGPKDIEGKLLNEMVMDTDQLPKDLYDMLSAGGGVEFDSEEELLETLDSLDEYVSYEYEDYYSGII